MGTRNVQNGTPLSGDWLCRTCVHSHIQQGHAESEEVYHCAYLSYDHPLRLEFKVRNCNNYQERTQSTLRDMEKVAWILLDKKPGRAVGFVTQAEFNKIEGKDAEVLP